MDTVRLVKELREEAGELRKQAVTLEMAASVLERGQSESVVANGSQANGPQLVAGKRILSQEAKDRISRAQKKRWSKWRKVTKSRIS